MQVIGGQRFSESAVLRLKNNYENHRVVVTLWLLFFLSVIVRTLISGSEKLLTTYQDEIYYYGLAENLARAHSFSIYYVPFFRADRIIYSMLIAPTFLVHSREIQFLLIALINSCLLSSGVFPVYLLAKDCLENTYWALFAGLIYLFMPDMAYAGTFMTDLCFLPEALWLFYLGYRLMEGTKLSVKKRVQYGGLFVGVLFLACVTKKAGVLFLPALVLAWIMHKLKTKEKKHIISKKHIMLLFFVVVCCVLFFVVAVKYVNISVLWWAKKVFDVMLDKPLEYLAYNGYSISQMVIAGCVFPVLFPYIYSKTYDEKGCRLLFFVGFVTLLVLLAESYVQVKGTISIKQIHLRYVMFLWMPYIVLFLKLLKQRSLQMPTHVKAGWGLLLIWVATLIYWNRGTEQGSAVDYTMLYFAEGWDSHWSIYAFVFCAFVAIAFAFVLRSNWRGFAIWFFAFWFVVQGYNNYTATVLITKNYSCDEGVIKDVKKTETFISSHEDKQFLLLLLPDEDDNRTLRRLSDTYLNYPNVATSMLDKYIRNEDYTGKGYDAKINPLPVYDGLGETYNRSSFDYIVLPRSVGCFVDSTKCTEVEAGTGVYFLVYKLNYSEELPSISTLRYLQRGHNFFSVDTDIFASQYQFDDEVLFISEGGTPGYVMYGPYCTLPPGIYNLTIYIEDNSGTIGECIGEADLNSSSHQLVTSATKLVSGDETVTFSFSSRDQIEMFEARVFTVVDGVRVLGVDIDYMPYND